MTLLAIHVEHGYQTSTMHALEFGYKLGSGAGPIGPNTQSESHLQTQAQGRSKQNSGPLTTLICNMDMVKGSLIQPY